MSTITFDTLEFVNQLKAAKVPDEQAQAQAQALRRVLDTALVNHSTDLATKGDIALIRKELHSEISLVRKDMEALRKDIIIKMGGMFIGAVGIIVGVLFRLLG